MCNILGFQVTNPIFRCPSSHKLKNGEKGAWDLCGMAYSIIVLHLKRAGLYTCPLRSAARRAILVTIYITAEVYLQLANAIIIST